MSNNAQPTLMVIDGHSLAFRAFYALPVDSFRTADGQHTNAIHGFISMMLNLLAKEKPTHLAVAFDISRYSFRTREYPEYKGTRGETPPEFIGQVPLLQDALHAMGITTITKEDFEADDILATLAAQGSAQDFKVLVVSGDRDTIQLIDDNVTLLYPSKQGVSELTRYDAAKVFERYGIQPHQYPEIAALVGETSDNLPGIPKVGEKTAVKWINEYGSLEEILRRADEIGGKVGESLREFKENAIRNRRLNRLIPDVDLPVGPADLERLPFDSESVKEVFGRLEFKSLLTRVLALNGEQDSTSTATKPSTSVAPVVDEVRSEPVAAAQAPRSQQLLDEELAAWLHRASETSPQGVAVELEVYATGIAVVGLATETETVSIPWSPVQADMKPLIEWFAGPTPKIFHGAKEQIKALLSLGIPLENLGFDTEIADWVLRPDSSKRELADLVKLYLNEVLPTPDPNQLVPDDSELDAGGRAWFVNRIDSAIRDRMEAATLALFLEIEIPSLTTLAAMEMRGVTVNKEKLQALSDELGIRAETAKNEAFAVIGREVNLASPKQLQEVLFDQLGMPKTRATKTGYTTDATALADLQATNPHPFLGLLLEHRDVTKLKQIVETLILAIGPDGRIHTTYGQTGTSTGRLSSANPNLQNIPIRTADGRRIREAFEVGEGFDALFTADYSQIEMRIMAHFSEDEGLIEAFISGEDLHKFVGARVFGVEPGEVTGEMRSQVKAMSYGLAYGLSAFGLARQLGIDNSAAKKLMADYFQRFGGVRDYLRSVVEQARAQGYTETLFDRRRPFPDLASPNRVLRDNAERAALNAPMQGTAADIMKIAMIGIEQDLVALGLKSQLLLQVHDELVLEVIESEREQVEKIVTDRMSHAAKLRVPLDVQIGVGANWNEAAH
ncbi:DNA polymerase-1 [Aurantimicrobium minutum]|uniref:DNA polymerase I n=1 Tax=Aurantimicrobium minutum TaxID=708131 RepID=UPI0024741326|nr:DNA polymerase I [Aurantimicrobium minutum]MDH6424711.1 DNA polymerase-1 [Aurantimicrobium minutum]